MSAIHWFLIQGCPLSKVLLYLNFQEEGDTNQQVTKVSYTSAPTIIIIIGIVDSQNELKAPFTTVH